MFYPSIENETVKLLNATGQVKPAIDLKIIAERLNIKITKRSLGKELSGVLVLKANESVIGVDSSQSTVRQRFTVAHEIGHFILHRRLRTTFIDEKIVFTRGLLRNKQEIEANAYAAALLMPAPLLRKSISRFKSEALDEDHLEMLAKEYKVSQIAMTYRLMNLELI